MLIYWYRNQLIIFQSAGQLEHSSKLNNRLICSFHWWTLRKMARHMTLLPSSHKGSKISDLQDLLLQKRIDSWTSFLTRPYLVSFWSRSWWPHSYHYFCSNKIHAGKQDIKQVSAKLKNWNMLLLVSQFPTMQSAHNLFCKNCDECFVSSNSHNKTCFSGLQIKKIKN